jgi:hypothetical protein
MNIKNLKHWKKVTYLAKYWKSDIHLPLQYWTGLFGKMNNISYRILEICYSSSITA